jgi:hypothetical protein
MTKGKLAAYRINQNGNIAIRLTVSGNVGADGRAVLDELGLTPLVDVANCREIITTTPAQLDFVRGQLLARGVIDGPAA